MSDSQSIRDSMRNAWNSERLIYRALQDNDDDHTFMHEAIAGDPVGFSLAYPESFRPQSKIMTASLLSMLRRKSLSVVICLSTDESSRIRNKGGFDPPGTQEAEPGIGLATEDTSAKRQTSAQVPIGILTLTAQEQEQHHHRKTMLGINIINDHQGRGYGPEAINWALDWAFKFGGMHRVGLACYGYNDRAQRLYERLGFVKEGTVRECHWFNRAWHDEIYYGMLESEWEKIRSLQQSTSGRGQ
ncbi:hypothetical protein O1611_g2986 [Lasiodiplodia mahajangana]|uniref:Uncharacterized protein n=1 Tax=Lasiodiplodia mahajangana TaxID=1108764 RepID=A0ACC2JSZ6_9PEZI|nr:hypothetical protein O1611_g2986 [Lasiodiplodia mahajangana]